MNWLDYLRYSDDDSATTEQGKRRLKYWLAFNLVVVAAPVAVRAVARVFTGEQRTLFSWEEGFFVALFLTASAIADLRQAELGTPSPPKETKVGLARLFWGLLVAFGAVLLIYGLSTGDGTIDAQAELLLAGAVVLSAVMLSVAAAFMVAKNAIYVGRLQEE